MTAQAVRPRHGLSLACQFGLAARSRPDAIAVVHQGCEITYRELDRRSAALAARIDATTAPDAFVGICLPSGPAVVVAIVAAIRAGRAYVPLDPTYPQERIRYLIHDARPAVTIVDDCTYALVFGDSPTIDVDAAGINADPVSAGPDLLPDPAVDTPAYVIYTSGSTGRPKGVVVTQANVAALLSAAGQVFTFNADDVWSLFHSVSFDFSVWEIWGALLHGARLVIIDDEARLAPELLLSTVEWERVTVFNVVPSLFREVAADFAAAPRPLPLRYVIFGGEPVHLPSVSEFRIRCASPPTFVNMYGITETTIHVTAHVLTTEDEQRTAVSPIGTPLPHLHVRLMDDTTTEVPAGEVGEMWISGSGVADGYLRRPDLTANRFVWAGEGDDRRRYYRSGDLARMNPAGALEYLGRVDDQVKIHGFRIELGEIEACLEALPGITAAAVTVETSRAGSPYLVAYVVPREVPPRQQAGNLGRELRESLRRILPGHLVPGRVVPLPALPRTHSGKLDRRHLTVGPSP